MQDIECELTERVSAANAAGEALAIRGSGSKGFLGWPSEGTPLDVSGHRGLRHYEPTELVLTARAGTPLAELEGLLAEHGQMLPFEPPHFGPGATLGGTIACGLSGPRRPYAGAARDFVLGVRCINGKGEALSFGGEVMKNVAGYDIARLMTGAFGTLGVLLEVSLKVLPRPERELTLVQELAPAAAVEAMNRWAGRPLPLSAACYEGGTLYLRLSGTESGLQAARASIGGAALADGAAFWESIREQRHGFFVQGDTPLWRLSVAPASPPLPLPGDTLIDWGGAQRWLRSEAPAEPIREAVADLGGHATLWRGTDRRGSVFMPLPAGLMGLHRSLKQAFDPNRILNPGRMYPDL